MAGWLAELRRVRMPFRKKIWAALGLCAFRCKAAVTRLWKRRAAVAKADWTPSRILYFEYTRAGDLICATPFLELIRRRWPDAKITLVVYKEVTDVARGIAEVDRVITLDRDEVWRAVRQLWSMRHAPDTLVLSHSINPLVAYYLLATDAPACAGYLWSHTYSQIAGSGMTLIPARHPFGHLVEQRLDIARAIGIEVHAVPDVRFAVDRNRVGEPVAALMQEIGEKEPSRREKVAVISPGSRMAAKQWPVDHFKEMVRRLLAHSRLRVILVGGPKERETADAVRAINPDRILTLAGETNFMEFAALVEACDVVVCNDSAALHVAAALRVPCVAIFGPVEPAKVVHRSSSYETVALQGTESCLCGYDVFDERPCSHDNICLTSLTPERVVDTVMRLLGEGRDRIDAPNSD